MSLNTPSYYANLTRVAMQFYLKTGYPAELLAVYVYARYAARAAVEQCAQSGQDVTS